MKSIITNLNAIATVTVLKMPGDTVLNWMSPILELASQSLLPVLTVDRFALESITIITYQIYCYNNRLHTMRTQFSNRCLPAS